MYIWIFACVLKTDLCFENSDLKVCWTLCGCLWSVVIVIMFGIIVISKPDPNMLKILLIILSSTSQKITHSYFILISLTIILILFFCTNVSGTYWHLEKHELDMYWFCCRYIYCANFSDTSKMVNESHPCLFLIWLISHVTVCHWF